MEYTTQDYLQAIEREQAKRATTYPKMIAKREKQGMPEDELSALKQEFKIQNVCLHWIHTIIRHDMTIDPPNAQIYLNELIREYKMRIKVYPRLIYFKRMDATTAQNEIAVWKSLCQWWAKNHLGIDELTFSSKKKK